MKKLFFTVLIGLAYLCQSCTQQEQMQEPFTAYLFTYFINNSPEGEQIRYAVSRNGYDFVPLNNGKKTVDVDAARWHSVRDPHILRGEDGKTFYMVATDMCSQVGWGSNDGILLMKSTDLINWTVTPIDFPTRFAHLFDRERCTNVWAPQTIYDKEAGKYMVYFSLGFDGEMDGHKGHPLTIYYCYANDDFTDLTTDPKRLMPTDDIIDADIVEHNGQYHAFLAGIWKCTAPSLRGPWTMVNKDKRYQQTDKNAEGPAVYKRNNSDEWVLMYDCFCDGYYQFCRSTDLENFTLVAQTETKGNFTPRHGTVIGITEAELERLLKAFPSDGIEKDLLTRFKADSNPIIRHKFSADPAPMVAGDTLWVFATHDHEKPDMRNKDWLLFSTTDMVNWTEYPAPLRLTDLSWDKTGRAYASQAIARNGKYYFYISTDGSGIGVAVADRPEGPYKDALGKPLITNADCAGTSHYWASIDPTVFIDDDGQAWLFWGNGKCYAVRLKENMIETEGEIINIQFNGFVFEEAPWIHKHNGKYYLSYASYVPERIDYAMADCITGPYTYKGVLTQQTGNSSTVHQGLVEFKNQWYFFYHTGAIGGDWQRAICVEPFQYNADGTINKIEQTTTSLYAK